MKTTILTIALLAVTLTGFKQSTLAATPNKEVVGTTLTDVTAINQIEVHGNVELYVTGGNTDKVKVYNNYYSESALVQDENGVLRVTNYSAQKLVVWVTAADLRSLNVYDNATVSSFGKLSYIDLDVELFDNAKVHLNLDTYTTSVSLNNHSRAEISGTINMANFCHDRFSFLNTSNLVAEHLTEKIKIHHMGMHDQPEFASL